MTLQSRQESSVTSQAGPSREGGVPWPLTTVRQAGLRDPGAKKRPERSDPPESGSFRAFYDFDLSDGSNRRGVLQRLVAVQDRGALATQNTSRMKWCPL